MVALNRQFEFAADAWKSSRYSCPWTWRGIVGRTIFLP